MIHVPVLLFGPSQNSIVLQTERKFASHIIHILLLRNSNSRIIVNEGLQLMFEENALICFCSVIPALSWLD
jgi:hypothetical protein